MTPSNSPHLPHSSARIEADNHPAQLPLQVATLSDVRAGKAMPFTRDEMSAINKVPVNAPVAVNYLGLVTDEQADRRHHGGRLKAVHQMGTATYAKLNAEFELKLTAGLLGENLITTPVAGVKDLDESTVCIGDVFQYGDGGDCIQLRIVQPRRPCYKINDQIGPLASNRNIASWITTQGIAGWYFQVVQEGVIESGMPVYLIERPYPFANLQSLWQLANQKQNVAAAIIEPWLAIDCLEDSWKKVLTKKIKPA